MADYFVFSPVLDVPVSSLQPPSLSPFNTPAPEVTPVPGQEMTETVGYEEMLLELQVTNQLLTSIFALLFISLAVLILYHFGKLVFNTLFHNIM